MLDLTFKKFCRDMHSRFDWARKCDFNEIDDDYVVVQLTEAEAAELQTIDVNSVWDDLPKSLADTTFLARNNGKLFLVNPEGYTYCRYIAPVTIGA